MKVMTKTIKAVDVNDLRKQALAAIDDGWVRAEAAVITDGAYYMTVKKEITE